MPALGIRGSRSIGDRRLHRGGGRRSAERSDGVQQLAPVADRCNANLPEILRCQLRQYLPIDLVVAEGRHIALKAQTLQPRLDVHAVILGSEERHLHLFEDIAPPVDLPAAALKSTHRPRSWLRWAMTAFEKTGIADRGNVRHPAPSYAGLR